MDKVLFSLGEFPVTLEAAIYAVATLVTGLLVILVVMSIRAGRERAADGGKAAGCVRGGCRHALSTEVSDA